MAVKTKLFDKHTQHFKKGKFFGPSEALHDTVTECDLIYNMYNGKCSLRFICRLGNIIFTSYIARWVGLY